MNKFKPGTKEIRPLLANNDVSPKYDEKFELIALDAEAKSMMGSLTKCADEEEIEIMELVYRIIYDFLSRRVG